MSLSLGGLLCCILLAYGLQNDHKIKNHHLFKSFSLMCWGSLQTFIFVLEFYSIPTFELKSKTQRQKDRK